jgi:hypothetical protein
VSDRVFIELHHESDPRYLYVEPPLPDRISLEDIGNWRWGKPLIVRMDKPAAVYVKEPDGDGWVRSEVLQMDEGVFV